MQPTDGIHKYFEGDVQYPFADVGAPELMHISRITQENRHSYTYTCPFCKKGLHPRLGKRNAHCYAHKPGESCELDRYIHTTAERLLKEKWERDEPFEITMKVRTECKNIDTCFFYKDDGHGCIIEERKTFDLKKQFTLCIVEKRYGEFVPDLCLIDENGKYEPIFIEIWSKHKNSEKKANSDYKIIEIRLKTVQDLEELPKHPITESETVTFSHFKTLKKSPSKEDGPHLMKYTLYDGTLKSYVDNKTVSCGNYKTEHHPKSIFEVVCLQDEIRSTDFRNYCNAIAIDRGYDIRTCYLCQLYGKDNRNKDYDKDAVFNQDCPEGCRRDIEAQGLIECNPEDAKACQEFKVKDIILRRQLVLYGNINRYIWFKKADGTIEEETQKSKYDWI